MTSTTAQGEAIAARGNVLVMAGAGTGKTTTLVERCLDCLGDMKGGTSLNQLLVVTFGEAAAAEVRKRLREALEKRASPVPQPGDENKGDTGVAPVSLSYWAEQLALFDTALIGTLHSFCFKLIQQHFHALGLDAQLKVLDDAQARLLANETLEDLLQQHYEARTPAAEAVRRLIQTQAGGEDKTVRAMVMRLHHHAQTRPDPRAWLAAQLALFAAPEPERWRQWLTDALADWRARWPPALLALAAAGNGKAKELAAIVKTLPPNFSAAVAQADLAQALRKIAEADEEWHGQKGKWRPALKGFLEECAFLASLLNYSGGIEPLVEDWEWTRGPMTTLLELAQEFSGRFDEIKREAGVVDFHDLEQFTLQLLWDFGANQPTAIARHWREKIHFVFVDEYQDINAAQDRIISALSRDVGQASSLPVTEASLPRVPGGKMPPELADKMSALHLPAGNRFLVGDVKQSIYRFRQADPQIFREYAAKWRGAPGRTIPLTENFRSREGLLQFINSVFPLLMREEIGGVAYNEEAKLRFGASDERSALSATADPVPRVELILRLNGRNQPSFLEDDGAVDFLAEMDDAEKEARLVALRLRELLRDGHQIWDGEKKIFRNVAYGDMAVLLRAPAKKAEGYAKQFSKLGVPLVVERGGFFDSTEVTDLLNLLRILDNPLQDLPLLAVLRSPLVGLSLDELATIRLGSPRGNFWTALVKWQASGAKFQEGLQSKVKGFLSRFHRWRRLARQASLSRCLETMLAETNYAEWLCAQDRGEHRRANVQKLLGLAQNFDQFQRQGLFRFLRFVEAQQEAAADLEVAPHTEQDAVRLMSIHQSKGLEFPVVVVPDLGKRFNDQDLRADIILDEIYGVCPQIKPPQSGRHYPSLPWWLAQLRQRRELRGEELRLLYVAMTRARDTLILTGSISKKKWESHWNTSGGGADITAQAILTAQSYADWLGLWFAQNVDVPTVANEGEAPFLRWSVHDDSRLATSSEAEITETTSRAEAFVLDATAERRLKAMLTWTYPFGESTRRAAKTSVTALRRQAAEGEDAHHLFQDGASSLSTRGRGRERLLARAGLTSTDIGLAYHKFLEHITIEKAVDAGSLQIEAQRLESERVLSPEERAALDFSSLAAFWGTELGRKIRTSAPHVRRELAFTARFSSQELAVITGEKSGTDLDGEFVVVQGVADLVVLLPKEIWLVDFKTDEVEPGELATKVRLYEPQMRLYAHALSRIYQRRPVTECWIQFLAVQKLVRVNV